MGNFFLETEKCIKVGGSILFWMGDGASRLCTTAQRGAVPSRAMTHLNKSLIVCSNF